MCVMYTVDVEHIHMAVFVYCLHISNSSETCGTSLLFVVVWLILSQLSCRRTFRSLHVLSALASSIVPRADVYAPRARLAEREVKKRCI